MFSLSQLLYPIKLVKSKLLLSHKPNILYNVHTNRAPQYLSDGIQTSSRSSSRSGLRSSVTAVYVKPRCRTKFGERGTAWNSLPHHRHHISDNDLLSAASKLNYFVALVPVSAPGRFVISATQMIILLLHLHKMKAQKTQTTRYLTTRVYCAMKVVHDNDKVNLGQERFLRS